MAQTAIQAFFPPHEPPPTPAPPPADPAQNERISLLLKHCIQNGPAFLATVKERQAQDPNFSFLFPHGPEHAYWRWALYCALTGLPPAPAPIHAMHPPPASLPPPAPVSIPPPVPPSSMQLSPETESGFAQVLEALSGSKDSVKAAQQWFMACGPACAGGLARMMAVRCVNGVQEYERKLHIVYLANDILFKGLSARVPGQPPASDPIAQAFLPMLGPMLAMVYQKGGRTEEILARLNKILNFWTERGVFESSAVEGMRTDMTGAADPAVVLAQRLAQVAAAAAAAKAAAAAAAAAPAPSASLPPPAAAAPAAPPMVQPPATSMAAPWGLMQPPPQPAAAPAGMPPAAVPPAVSSAGAAPAMAWPPQPPLQGGPWAPPPHPLQPPLVGHPHTYAAVPPQMGIPGAQPPQPWGYAMPPGSVPPPGHPYAPPPMAGHPMYPPPYPGAPHLAPPGYAPPPVSLPPPPDVSGKRDSSSSRSSSSSESPPPPPSRPRVSKFHSEPIPPPHVLQATVAAAAAAQQQQQQQEMAKAQAEPIDSCSFPPGLLPALCRRKRETGGHTYEPLSASDIESTGLPPPPEKDDYLASRCERFFAEMRDYRPGLTRADVEDPGHSWHRMRLKKEYEEDPEGLKQRWWRGGGKRVTGGREPGRLHADGTFTGRAEQHAGLGAHIASAKARERHPEEAASAAAAGEGKNKIDDMYNQYRHHRSGSYHQMIFANSAKAKMLAQPPPNIMKGDLPFVPPT